jgi:hypothetical protein
VAQEDHVKLPDDFERLLRTEMSVVPSPAFLPGVRQRVATEEMRGSKWTWRILVPAGALAAASALAISLSGVTDAVNPPDAPARPVLQTMAPIARVMPLPANYPVARENLHPPVRRVAIATPAEPTVVVDERQRTALNTLLRMVHQGRLTEAAFAETVRTSLEPIRDGVVPLGVDALAVSPIEAGGVLQSGTEK